MLTQPNVWILKSEPEINLRVLFFDQKMLLPINWEKTSFRFYKVFLFDVEVRSVVMLLNIRDSERLVGVWDTHCIQQMPHTLFEFTFVRRHGTRREQLG